MLLKAHATGLATGKNANLLGMVDEIEIDVDLPVVSGICERTTAYGGLGRETTQTSSFGLAD